jgi:hypothetical protein
LNAENGSRIRVRERFLPHPRVPRRGRREWRGVFRRYAGHLPVPSEEDGRLNDARERIRPQGHIEAITREMRETGEERISKNRLPFHH